MCPREWLTAETGGYFCQDSGGCSPESQGPFSKQICRNQCTIGTVTVRTRVSTTLFCWSLAQPGYEVNILLRQKQLSAGIFACDDASVLLISRAVYGASLDAIDMLICEEAPVGMSKDGTAANSLQFMKAWEVLKTGGKYAQSDWTVKVDPDSVILPDRLRKHLNEHRGESVYVRNCDKPMAEGSMMFGSVEAISRPAMEAYYSSGDQCSHDLPWAMWGEDLFMMRCLEHLGVSSTGDFDMVQDGVCKGVWCGSTVAAAFHPMKSVDAWEACWRQAIASG